MRRADVLAAALDVFREKGYAETTLEHVAQRARVPIDELQARFAAKEQLLQALLEAHSPLKAMETALDSVEDSSADEMLRDAMRRMVKIIEHHRDFVELAMIDVQVNNGSYLATLSARIFPKAIDLLNRLKATGELRPVADPVLGRTIVAMLMGFVLSERTMPTVARMAMRLFPQRAWLDGMVDLLLYGVLENE